MVLKRAQSTEISNIKEKKDLNNYSILERYFGFG